jgi:hypothetical protein
MRAALPTAAGLALALALAACNGGGEDGDGAFAAGNVAETLDSGSVLPRLLSPLEVDGDLVGQLPDVARMLKIQGARQAFERMNPSCVTVTSGPSYLEVSFASCRIPPLPLPLLFTVDGSLRAEISVEAVGGLASRVVIAVTIPGLAVIGPLRSRQISGTLQLRQQIAAGPVPVELDGELGIVIEGAPLGVSLAAAWTLDGATGCVTFSGGAELAGEALGALGPIALSGDAIHRCRSQCPASGYVELSYGRGELLIWTYTGADTVLARGPRGRRIEVPLPCGGD